MLNKNKYEEEIPEVLELDDTASMRRFIVDEPAVIRQLEASSAFEAFTSNGTIAAAVMVFAAILAVIVANSPVYHIVHEVLESQVGIVLGPLTLAISVEGFINDGLMAVFFFLVGIELKYEMTVGQLRRPRQAALPMLAAVGGVVAPALIYLLFNHGETMSGWAIPIATDIAFALGVMSLLGDRIAPETKVFFQTLAIADDILAIVVLAACYGQTPDIAWCAATVGVILVLALINSAKIYSLKPYLVTGVILWFCMFMSGIHATLAGVILAFFLPAQSDIRLPALRDWLDAWGVELDDRYDDRVHVLGQHDFTDDARTVERVMHHVTPPLLRAEQNTTVFVNFVVLPLFAFANAQVRLVGADIAAIVGSSVTQGAYFGAVLGKPIGIILVTFLLVRIGFAKLPRHVDWVQVIAVGIMGGLGFTMSILIAGLAFTDPDLVMAAKCAILVGSVTSGVLGIVFVRVAEAVLASRRNGERGKS